MARIWEPGSPLARCSVCGVERQFHFASGVPHSADRDHDFVAETIADFEPGDLTPEQLLSEIVRLEYPSDMRLTGWRATDADIARATACRDELRNRIPALLGVSWDDLSEALA